MTSDPGPDPHRRPPGVVDADGVEPEGVDPDGDAVSEEAVVGEAEHVGTQRVSLDDLLGDEKDDEATESRGRWPHR